MPLVGRWLRPFAGRPARPAWSRSSARMASLSASRPPRRSRSRFWRGQIEFSVQEGKRPAFVNCKTCGRPVKVERFGVLPVVCRPFAHRCPLCDKPMKIKASVCGFGKTCKKCRVSQHMRKVANGRRKFSDDDLRRVFKPGVTYEGAAAALGVSPSVIYCRAKALGLGSGRRRGVPHGAKWSARRRAAG